MSDRKEKKFYTIVIRYDCEDCKFYKFAASLPEAFKKVMEEITTSPLEFYEELFEGIWWEK